MENRIPGKTKKKKKGKNSIENEVSARDRVPGRKISIRIVGANEGRERDRTKRERDREREEGKKEKANETNRPKSPSHVLTARIYISIKIPSRPCETWDGRGQNSKGREKEGWSRATEATGSV